MQTPLKCELSSKINTLKDYPFGCIHHLIKVKSLIFSEEVSAECFYKRPDYTYFNFSFFISLSLPFYTTQWDYA